jgi:rubredoxin
MKKTCPECGASWESVTVVDETLSHWGYSHVDKRHMCAECHARWLHGVPEGQTRNDDLICPVCGDVLQYHKREVRAHQADVLHWKCPTCYYWTDEVVEIPGSGDELIAGYSEITGDIDHDE